MTPLPWMKWAAGAVLAVSLVCLGWGARGCSSSKVASAALTHANQQDAPAVAALGQGVDSATAAQAKDPAIKSWVGAVAHDHARMAMDAARARAPRPVQPPSAPGAPDPQPVPEPLDADKDQLIVDLTGLTEAQAAKLTDLQSAYDSMHTAALGFQSEAASLRIAVTALSGRVKPWAAGVVYGTSSTMGAAVERDAGPFRFGAQVTRRLLPAGNATVDATVSAMWRF